MGYINIVQWYSRRMSAVQSLKQICDRIDAMHVTVMQAEKSLVIEEKGSPVEDDIHAIKAKLIQEGIDVPDIGRDAILIEYTRGITLKISKDGGSNCYCVCELSLENERFKLTTNIPDINVLTFLVDSLNDLFLNLVWEYNSCPKKIDAFELEDSGAVRYDEVCHKIQELHGDRFRNYKKGIQLFYQNNFSLLLQITPGTGCCFYLCMAGTDKWRKTHVEATHHPEFRSLIKNLGNVDFLKWQ